MYVVCHVSDDQELDCS